MRYSLKTRTETEKLNRGVKEREVAKGRTCREGGEDISEEGKGMSWGGESTKMP